MCCGWNIHKHWLPYRRNDYIRRKWERKDDNGRKQQRGCKEKQKTSRQGGRDAWWKEWKDGGSRITENRTKQNKYERKW